MKPNWPQIVSQFLRTTKNALAILSDILEKIKRGWSIIDFLVHLITGINKFRTLPYIIHVEICELNFFEFTGRVCSQIWLFICCWYYMFFSERFITYWTHGAWCTWKWINKNCKCAQCVPHWVFKCFYL